MHETILIAGDDVEVRAILRQALERAGYVTAEAADGSEMLAVLRFMQFDLLITDMAMPERVAPKMIPMAVLPKAGEHQRLLDTVRAVLAGADAVEVSNAK